MVLIVVVLGLLVVQPSCVLAKALGREGGKMAGKSWMEVLCPTWVLGTAYAALLGGGGGRDAAGRWLHLLQVRFFCIWGVGEDSFGLEKGVVVIVCVLYIRR